jgi:hypothetical protein
MTDLRYIVGMIFVGFAVALLHFNCPVWSVFPAATGVYILGSQLWDVINGR